MEENEAQEPTVTEFKGNKVLVLNPDSKYPFSFGVSKAILIIKYLKYIQAFVDEHGGKKDFK